MTILQTMRYGMLAIAIALGCYVVVFHGFGAVAKGVLEQTRMRAGEHSGGRWHLQPMIPVM